LIAHSSFFFDLVTGVKAGGDRQDLHEAIRVHSMEAGSIVKGEGKPNDLMDRIANDQIFAAVHDKLDTMIDPILFVGRAPEQVDEFLSEEVNPVLEANAALLEVESVDGVNV
jgi:adenylosuccinate lyase